jgi:hypothetical protein
MYICRNQVWNILVSIAAGLFFVVATSHALAEPVSLKGRDVLYNAADTWTQIGEKKSRGIGTYEVTGLSFMESGETGTALDRGSYMYEDGVSSAQGVYVVTFSDGSSFTQTYRATSKPGDKGIRISEGTFEFVEGTGRYSGIDGNGRYTGKQYPNDMIVLDWQAQVEIPE